MATLMQKDVLIDAVADAVGLMVRISYTASEELKQSMKEDRNKMSKLGKFLYDTGEEDIDYLATYEKIKEVKSRWRPIRDEQLALKIEA